MKYFKLLILVFISINYNTYSQPQPKIVDKIVAIVGNKPILMSEIDIQYLQLKMQSGDIENNIDDKCQLFESILINKLLVTQAQIDSVMVSDAQVNERIDRNLKYFISQFGSQRKLEEYYKKPISEIKEELKRSIREQMIVETMQENITKNVVTTPTDVKNYFNAIDKDSIPIIPSQYEISEIVILPKISVEQMDYIKEKLNGFRERILKGENFATLAILYSEDKGSAPKGGDIGFTGRGELYPEFETVAYSLKPGEVSQIVKTKAGFHIIQMIERRGDVINVRHILLQPQAATQDIIDAKFKLDTIVEKISKQTITFEEAVKLYSESNSKMLNGAIVNPYTISHKFTLEQIDQSIVKHIDKMQVGDISPIIAYRNDEGAQAFRIIKLVKKDFEHKANLIDDYDKIQRVVLEDKKNKAVQKWIEQKINNIYVKITDDYKNCKFSNNWKIKN